MAIRAVLFDLDDTLWRVRAPPDWEQITILQAAELVPEFARMGLADRDLRDFVRRFWRDFDAAPPDPDSIRDPPLEETRWLRGPDMIRGVLAGDGVECAKADGQRPWEALHNVPLRHFNVELFPDAVSTVEALSAAGYRLAVVTSRPLPAKILRRELRDQGLLDGFEAIVAAGEVGYPKPHPLVFETALALLGVQPEEAVVVGDSYDDDVVPAAALGMVAVLKLNEREPNAEHVLASYQVSTLDALLQLPPFRR